MPRRQELIDRRLQELTSSPGDEVEKPRMERLIKLFKRIGEKAPVSPKEMGQLKLRLVQAGYRRPEAVTIFFGIRIMFALGLFLLFSSSLLGRANTMMAL